ncbi:MAG TPA: ABC transporter ATP-binding protein [Mycobacteriales bacterium]|nr:ABC transporter ATP-binding protein [Mycobacteriales bacterium]
MDTTADRADAPIDVAHVTKRFGELTAVADLTFSLRRGTITGFLGPNGAGKSTTLRMVGGLLRPTTGDVRLFGVDARDPRARRPLGYMPADPSFLPNLSGRDNLDLLLRLRGDAAAGMRQRALQALDLDESDLGRRVGGYSSGMRQKLAIVAAVQHSPALVVLDEPANRLDPIAHRSFCRLVREMAAEGATVLLSSHVLAEVEAVCDSVLLVRDGALLKEATVDELREDAPRVVTLTYASPPERLPSGLSEVRTEGTTVIGRLAADRAGVLRDLLTDPDVVDVTVVPASLEDVVLALYSGAPSS